MLVLLQVTLHASPALLPAQGKNDGVLSWARAAKQGTELAPATAPEGLEIATVAGGCFWGLELAYQRLPGVVKTSVGYTAGQVGEGSGKPAWQVASPACVRCSRCRPAALASATQPAPTPRLQVPNPTYEEVCGGRTGHTEAVQVRWPCGWARRPTEASWRGAWAARMPGCHHPPPP